MSSPIPFDSAIILFCQGLVAWNLEKKLSRMAILVDLLKEWYKNLLVWVQVVWIPKGSPFIKEICYLIYVKGTRFKSQTTGPQNTHLPLVEYTCTKN